MGTDRNKPMRAAVRALTSVAVLASSQAVVPAAVHAGVYQAICSTGSRCTVTIAGGKIISPSGTIDKEKYSPGHRAARVQKATPE